MSTAARAALLGGFTEGRSYCEDGDYSPRSWLVHRTRITTGAAAGHTAWARRAGAHPRVAAAMAAGGAVSPTPTVAVTGLGPSGASNRFR